MPNVNIAGLEKHWVLRTLVLAASPRGFGAFHHAPTYSPEQAKIDVDRAAKDLYFDYVNGCPIKVSLKGDEFDPRLFDRDQGEGAAERAIARLRESLTTAG